MPRPKGTKNITRPAVVYVPPTCPVCPSTEHEVLRITNEQDISGERDGRPYNHIVWRRVQCKACGQHYMLVTYEFRPELAEKNSGQTATFEDQDLNEAEEE
jgi:transcriptional regulator NrdR family protein